MVKFTDGPAAGVTLLLKRAPIYLRVVRDPDGKFDALDQLDDAPEPGETLCAYRLVSEPGSMHLCFSDPKTRRRTGGWFATGAYAACDPQPDDATMRDTAAWQQWAREADRAARQAAGQEPQ